MGTTGKKRLTIEFEAGAEEEILKDFKKKCLDQGKSFKEGGVAAVTKYVRREEV